MANQIIPIFRWNFFPKLLKGCLLLFSFYNELILCDLRQVIPAKITFWKFETQLTEYPICYLPEQICFFWCLKHGLHFSLNVICTHFLGNFCQSIWNHLFSKLFLITISWKMLTWLFWVILLSIPSTLRTYSIIFPQFFSTISTWLRFHEIIMTKLDLRSCTSWHFTSYVNEFIDKE